jgi:ABC-2 type transport system permease protein
MFKFNLKRGLRDIYGHLILIAFPVVLIAFFNFIYKKTSIFSGTHGQELSILTILTIGFALTFQVYGAALSFDTIAVDFFSPIKDRLAASPADLRRMIISILTTATIVSFFQTLFIVLFSIVVLNVSLPKLYLILPVMVLSIIFHQLFGSVIMLASRSVKTSNAIMTTYGSVAPMLIGLYFPLPNTPFFTIVRTYSTPVALANTAIKGIVGNDMPKVVLALIPLLLLTFVLFFLIRPLIKKVAS